MKRQSIETTLREEQWVPLSELLDRELPPVAEAFRGLYEKAWETFVKDAQEGKPKFYNQEQLEYSSVQDWETLGQQFGIEPYDVNLTIPPELIPAARYFCRDLRAYVGVDSSCGGCQAFYTPEEASNIVNTAGAVLVVIHDGGALAPYFNLSYECYDLYDKVDTLLGIRGLWRESYNAAVTLIYPA